MEGGGYLHITRTHQKMEMVPCEDCHSRLLGMLKVYCPVNLGKPEVRSDPTCRFDVQVPSVEMAAQSKQASQEQLLVSPRVRCAVGAHVQQGRLLSSPVMVGVGQMEGGFAPAWPDKPTPSSLAGGVGRALLPLAQRDSVSRWRLRRLTSLASAQHVAFKQ